jgi:hypothetical protein
MDAQGSESLQEISVLKGNMHMSTRGFIGFKHKGKVFGHFNHWDSYPAGIGVMILHGIYCKYPWEVIQDFFLNRVTYVGEHEDPNNQSSEHKYFFSIDFAKDTVNLIGDKDFYKDGLFCEYSYIFDLDSPTKRLMLFKGFGKKPAKGYEDWFVKGARGEKFYQQPCGAIEGDLPHCMAYATMRVKFYEGKDANEIKTLKAVLTCPPKELPKYLGLENELIGEIVGWRVAHEKDSSKRITSRGNAKRKKTS